MIRLHFFLSFYFKAVFNIRREDKWSGVVGTPLCKFRELSQREYSLSHLCNIRHDIPVTLHTPGAYGQCSVFDHSGDKQTVVFGQDMGLSGPGMAN